jgi:diphthamide biosynthesis protein 3
MKEFEAHGGGLGVFGKRKKTKKKKKMKTLNYSFLQNHEFLEKLDFSFRTERGRRRRRRESPQKLMSGSSAYDEVDLEDMEWNEELKAYTYSCPCGDIFRITLDELHDGEEIARCPSCSLILTVVYDPDELPARE